MDLTHIPVGFTNLDPKLWGRPIWETMEMILITYPEKDPPQEKRDAVYQFLESLSILLPCESCRDHYKIFLDRVLWNTVLSGRQYLFEFYFELRKDVATRSNEEFSTISKEECWKRILRRFHLYIPDKNEKMRTRMIPVSSILTGTTRKHIPVSISSNCNCGGKK
jgi:hypothetical protein